jgi:hypothetical protein
MRSWTMCWRGSRQYLSEGDAESGWDHGHRIAQRTIGRQEGRDTEVEGGEPAGLADGQLKQQGIGELMMTGDPLADFGANSGETVFERPEMVCGTGGTLGQGVHRIAKQHPHFDYGRLHGEPHEGQLSERAGRPARFTVFLKPPVCGRVVNVDWPSKRKENIDVEQKCRHCYPIRRPESRNSRPTSRSSRSIARVTSLGPKEGVPEGT